MMIQNKTLTFVIAHPKIGKFTEDIYGLRNFMKAANAVVLHEVSLLFTLFEFAKNDFEFRIVVHAGISDTEKDVAGSEGMNYMGELLEYPPFRNLTIPFITRKRSLFLSDHVEKLTTELGGYKYMNANLVNDLNNVEKAITEIPLLKKSDILHEPASPISVPPTSNSSGKLDFAILTALYENEFQAYEDYCVLDEESLPNNSYTSFKEVKKNIEGGDYQGRFFVAHQEQMGLVDAAIYSTRIIDTIDPRFLIMGGVCGGLKKSVNLYDIIIPTIIYDYATGKLREGGLESKKYKANSEQLLTNDIVRNKSKIIRNMKKLIDKNREKLISRDFEIHVSEFACGPWVVKTDGFLDDFLLNEYSKMIKGLEMESYSVNRAGNIAQKYGRYSLVVKSVMDFTTKDKTDGQFGEMKSNASYMSLLCIRAMMPIFLRFRDPKTSA